MTWHPMKPETIERRARERAAERLQFEVESQKRYREIVARHEADGDHEGAQLYREIFGID